MLCVMCYVLQISDHWPLFSFHLRHFFLNQYYHVIASTVIFRTNSKTTPLCVVNVCVCVCLMPISSDLQFLAYDCPCVCIHWIEWKYSNENDRISIQTLPTVPYLTLSEKSLVCFLENVSIISELAIVASYYGLYMNITYQLTCNLLFLGGWFIVLLLLYWLQNYIYVYFHCPYLKW